MLQLEQMPKNEDAERALVGLCLIDRMIPAEAKDLATTDFSNQFMQAAWSAMLEIEENGEDIDPIAVGELFRRDGVKFGVSELMGTTAVALRNPGLLAGRVRDAAVRRRIMRQLYASIEEIGSGRLATSDIRARIGDIEVASAGTGKFRRFDDIIARDVLPALAELRAGRTMKVSTGFEILDRMIGGGLSPSDVMVVAALTGIGKSAFVLQMATAIASSMVPVAFVSGEMTDRENGLRMLSQATRFFNLNAATRLYDDQYTVLLEWADALKSLPIWFDSTTFDLASLRKAVGRLVEAHGIRVLFIDYLQLFRVGRSDRQSRTERIAEASQEVRRIALEFGISVVEVVQFNREGSKNGKPGLHDLEGSSQLEKDASIVLVIDREDEAGRPGRSVTVRIVKGRNAPLSEFSGVYDGASLRFDFEGGE